MFIPRHPVVENQFCSYTAQATDATGVGGVLCYAGAVVYLQGDSTNQEAIVEGYDRHSTLGTLATSELTPFGFSMQKVKSGYHQVHPAGFMMPGDLGSSDVIAQPAYTSGSIAGTKEAPLGVAHLGIWDTVHYTSEFTGTKANGTAVCAAINPGDMFLVANFLDSMITNSANASGDDTIDGQYLNTITTNVARAVKGVSAAKCSANVNNTTLYPIRIKLLI
jgi:hypothetical protein